MKAANKRQVIATWYRPEEKLPPEAKEVYASFSGSTNDCIYNHDKGVAVCYYGYADEPPMWLINGLTARESADCRIEAWCDLKPY